MQSCGAFRRSQINGGNASKTCCRVLDGLAIADTSATATTGNRSRLRFALIVAAASIAIGLVLAAAYAMRSKPTASAIAVGKIVRVTAEPGLEIDPAISPDGRAIAYAAGIPGSMRIYVQQIAGGRKTALTDEGATGTQRWPRWSADAARILFQAGRTVVATGALEGGQLMVAPSAGGAARPITTEQRGDLAVSPAWSPDDRRIAFGGAGGLHVVDAGNPDRLVFLAPEGEVHSPAWSPDGRRIACVSRGISFTFGETSMGNLSTSTILIVDVESRKVTSVTSGDWLDVNPVWMPDGQGLLFVSNRAGGRDVFRQRLSSGGDQPDGAPERITSGLNAHGISISRDGRLLANWSYTQRANIWSIAIPEGTSVSVREAQQVTFGTEKIEKLAVSWDGKWLAYDSDRDGQANIWKMPLAGGPLEQVTHGPNNKFVNDWSPDGEEIVYHSMREGGQRDVMVVSADGHKDGERHDEPSRRAAFGLGTGRQQHHLRFVRVDHRGQQHVHRQAREARRAVGNTAAPHDRRLRRSEMVSRRPLYRLLCQRRAARDRSGRNRTTCHRAKNCRTPAGTVRCMVPRQPDDLLQGQRRAAGDEHLGSVDQRRGAEAAGDVRRSVTRIPQARVRYGWEEVLLHDRAERERSVGDGLISK